MSTTLWIFIAVAIFVVLAFISYMARLIKRSKQIEKNLDYDKMKPWRDEDQD